MDVIYRYDPFAPVAPRNVPDADAATARLTDGNARFADIVRRMQERTLGGDAGEPIVIPMCPITMGLPLYEGAMPSQAPFAVIVGCSDARVPTEIVFDQFFNDLFVLRVAGNVLGSECIGSLHYALGALAESLKLVVVLGHSKCGAVTAAVDTYLSPADYVDIGATFALRSLVDQIQVSVRGAARALERHGGSDIANDPEYRSMLVAVSVYVNAAVSAFELEREIRLSRPGGPRVAFGAFDFQSMRVQCSPPAAVAGNASRLRRAPESADELVAYADELAGTLLTMDDDDRNDLCQLTIHP